MEKHINMTKNNFTELKSIKISYLILLLLIACSTPKKIEVNDEKQLVHCLNDFISEYKVLKPDRKLSAILIRCKAENNFVTYTICDSPVKVIYGGLNNLKRNKSNSFSIGVYNDILCQLYTNDLTIDSTVFKEVGETVKERALSAEIVTDNNGKTYTLDLSLLNWEPEIEIAYNINETKKVIHCTKTNKTESKKINFGSN